MRHPPPADVSAPGGLAAPGRPPDVHPPAAAPPPARPPPASVAPFGGPPGTPPPAAATAPARRHPDAPQPPQAPSPLRALRNMLKLNLPGGGRPSPPRRPRAAAPAESTLLGAGRSPSVFPGPPPGARGLLAPGGGGGGGADSKSSPNPAGGRTRTSGTWNLAAWKVFTLDLYVRLLERPRDSRLRLKQTVALLPFLKLKPTVDVSADPRWAAPVRMRLDVKLLGCVKLRVLPDGNAALQVRARAPLEDPRLMMDVLYDRDLASGTDSVKLTFRALDMLFFKAPHGAGAGAGAGGGVKIPVHFSKGVKSTIRVKKYLLDRSAPRTQPKRPRGSSTGASSASPPNRGWLDFSHVPETRPPPPPRRRATAGGGRPTERWGVEGPAGLDVKMRLWEFGNGPAAPAGGGGGAAQQEARESASTMGW